MENQSKSNLEHAMKWGLILGISNILLYLFVYIISKVSLVAWWLGIISIVLNVTILILAINSRKKEEQGQLNFNHSFLTAFYTYACAALLQCVFNYLLYNVIDSELSEFIKTESIRMTTSMLEKFGAQQDVIDKSIEGIQIQDFSQTPVRILKSFFFMLCFGAVLAAILGAIFKTKRKASDID